MNVFFNNFNNYLLNVITAIQAQSTSPISQAQSKSYQSQVQTFIDADTKYHVLKEISDLMQFHQSSDVYNILWTDHALSIKEIRDEPLNMRINHIPDITQITRKNKMAMNLNSMRIFFPKAYNFFPQSWVLPGDYQKIAKKHVRGKIYIVKPQNGCQGQGIYLVDNPSKIDKGSTDIVQQYVMRPYLINQLKFDMRWYALITCVSPLRVYLYNDGIMRFATQKFQKPNPNNLNSTFTHLTNYAINKHSQKFIIDQKNQSSHKRLISSVFKNNEYNQLFNAVSQIVMKTIISAWPAMHNGYLQCKKSDPSSCFQLLGFDIMLTDKKEPVLLQVNQNPSLSTDTQFDHKLKSKLVRNIMQMVTGGYNPLSQDKMQNKIKLKDKHENTFKDNFIKIYPCKTLQQTENYDIFMNKASSLYRDRFGITAVRTVKKKQTSRVQQSYTNWNQQPNFYGRSSMQKVYGSRTARTSTVRKRLIFL